MERDGDVVNVIFWILVVAAMVFVWHLLSWAFPALGALLMGLHDDTMRHINQSDEEDKNK